MSSFDAKKLFAPDTGNLNKLEHAATIQYRHELARKGIHLFSLSIPTIYYFISKELALAILIPITIAFLSVDIARYYIPDISTWFYYWFGWLLRRHETDNNQKRLNGASHVLIAASLCVFIFPKIIAINAITILIISDTTSALIGRRFGRHRFFGKSLEGSTAFFVSAMLVILVAPKIHYVLAEYLVGFVAALIGAIVEALPIKVDDNLSIPISVGLVMWGLYSVMHLL